MSVSAQCVRSLRGGKRLGRGGGGRLYCYLSEEQRQSLLEDKKENRGCEKRCER